MVQLLQESPATSQRRHPNLILHCGAAAVELDQVARVITPRPTSTWHPIPHHQLIETVQCTLAATNLKIGGQAHSLTHDGSRYFGIMEIIQGRESSADYCWVLGLRNSHDKTFPAGIVAGASCFVCDNLSFSGDVKIARKHTRYINRDLPQLVSRAVGMLHDKWNQQDKRIEAYKNHRLGSVAAHDLIVRSVDVGVCANSYIPDVLKQWREPRHEVFQPRNVWSLFNAFTEALKQASLSEALKDDQYSLHAHHVHADMLVNIAETLRGRDDAACMLNLSRAAAIVDRALLLIPPRGPKTAEQHASANMLKQVRDQILFSFSDGEAARTAALSHFDETGDQAGLAFVGRMMLGKALTGGKGRQFKKVDEFIREAFKRVTANGGEANGELLLCRVELIINWHVLPNHGPVYWEEFVEDIHKLQLSPRFSDDAVLTFFRAVGEFHLRHYPDAEVLFQRLRMDRQWNESRRDIRCYYIGDKTDPQILEGRIRGEAAEKRFIYCSELGMDVLVKPGNLMLRPDEPKHCRVGFSMQGPIAVDRE